jgi:CAAX prenyl protease-like protein
MSDTEIKRDAGTGTETPRSTVDAMRAAGPYVVPMFGYLVLTSLEGYLPAAAGGKPSPRWYPLAYAAKVAIVAVLMVACRSAWRDLAPRPKLGALALAVALGLLVTAAWVGLDGLYPTFGLSGTRAAFDPTALKPPARWAFVAVRLLGLVVLVPLFEELFWRSFLIRWLIDDDFTRVPIGRVTPTAAAVSSVLFAAVHPEWLPALLTGLAWAWLLRRTRSVTACVVSHATANLSLGLYVLATGHWKFW